MLARLRHENEEEASPGQHRNDGQPVTHARAPPVSSSPRTAGLTEVVRGGDDRRDAGGEILGLQTGLGLAVNEQAVTAQNDRGIHSSRCRIAAIRSRMLGITSPPGKWWRS
jgi:hypothetical protein